NAVMYYGTQFLHQAGFSADAALIANIANGVLAVVGSAICLFVVIDRVPRRKLILFGFIACTIVHGLMLPPPPFARERIARAYAFLVLCVTFVFFMQMALNVPVWVC